VIEEHINNIKKIDPNMNISKAKRRGKTSRSISTQNKAKPNIQILAEILNSTNTVPYSGKPDVKKALKSSQRPGTSNDNTQNKDVFIQNESDIIDEHELLSLQHKVLSQNIKQGIKRNTTSKRFFTIEEEEEADQKHADTFREFKNFIRPSTSAINFHQAPNLLKSHDSKNNDPKFLSSYDKFSDNEIKTYKNLNKKEKHLLPLEINYKYQVVDFYSENRNLPTTASQGERKNKNQAVKLLPKTSQGKRSKISNKFLIKDQHNPLSNFKYARSSSTGELVESIPSKRPVTRNEVFAEDFCITNTLVSYTI
jgi:hypothetical protein